MQGMLTMHGSVSMLSDKGWIDGIIKFDGKNWTLMDASICIYKFRSKETKDFITNKSNYTVKYMY